MTAQIRRLREGVDDEVPIHYEGMELRPIVRAGARIGGSAAAMLGILGMVRGAGTPLEPAGALLGALGVVVVILSWRFRRFEIVAGDRWLILRCGPVRHRFGRSDVAVGDVGPAGSWRRLYSDREVAMGHASSGRTLRFPINDVEELRRVADPAARTP